MGQSVLVQHYENAFKPYGIATAQILLVHDDVTAGIVTSMRGALSIPCWNWAWCRW